MFEALKENEAVVGAVNFFAKVTLYGGIILGSLLILEKVLGLTFELSINLGL